jgi:chaperonin cofactor prefoldin
MIHTSKTMQKHVAQPLTQLETTKKRCPDHTDLLLEYFCIDCTELVCVKCILMKQHKDHKFVQSTEYRSKISNEINESQVMLSSRIKILAKTQKSIELSIQELSEVHSELNSRIQVEWGKVLTATKHRIANMLTHSAYVEQEKSKCFLECINNLVAWLERQREAITLFLQQLKEDTEYYNSRIETMSIPQLLHFKRQIVEVTEVFIISHLTSRA